MGHHLPPAARQDHGQRMSACCAGCPLQRWERVSYCLSNTETQRNKSGEWEFSFYNWNQIQLMKLPTPLGRFSCMQSVGPALLQSHEELLCFKSGRIKESVGLQSLARGVFKTDRDLLPFGADNRRLLSFLHDTKTPSVLPRFSQRRLFTSWGRDRATCEAGVLLQEEDSALFLNIFWFSLIESEMKCGLCFEIYMFGFETCSFK